MELGTRQRYLVVYTIAAFFLLVGFLAARFRVAELLRGLWEILTSSGVLITDYIALAGTGPAFVNTGLVILVTALLMNHYRLPMDGVSIMTVGFMAGFAMFGKNLLNMWFMLFGNIPLLCLGAAFSAFGMASSTVLVPLVTKRIFGTRDFAPIWSIISMATVLGCALGSPAWGMVYDFLGTYKPAVIIVPFIVIADGLILVRMMSDKRAVIWEDK